MKKVLSGIVILAVSISLLSGCGGKAGSQPSPAEAGAPVEVTFGRKTTSNPKFPEGDTYEDNAYTRYVTEKLNIKVVNAFEASGEDYDRQISLAIASGDLPDVMVVGKAELDELVENDLVADLTDVYEEYASDYIKGVYDSYEGRVLDAARYDGRLMALPGANVDGAPTMAWIRQDWLDKLGIQIDEDGDNCITLEEVELVAREFKEKDPGNSGNPVSIAFSPELNSTDNNGSFVMTALTAAMGAYPQQWLESGDGTVIYGTTAPEMKEALALLHRWYQEGIIDEQYGTRSWDDINAAVVNEQNGLIFGPWHIPDWLLNNVHAMNQEAQFTAFAVENAEGKVNAFHANPGTPGFVVVSKEFEHPEILVQLENLFYDELQNSKTLAEDAPEVYQYVRDAVDGSAKPWQVEVLASTSLTDDYEEYTKCLDGELAVEDLSRLESKMIVDAVSAYLDHPETADSNEWARYTSRLKGVALIKRLTEEDKFHWITPIYPSTTSTMKTAWANLAKLENESVIGFITGTKPLDDFDQFVENWMAQGGKQIIEEVAGRPN